jgi:hypothetical protein
MSTFILEKKIKYSLIETVKNGSEVENEEQLKPEETKSRNDEEAAPKEPDGR